MGEEVGRRERRFEGGVGQRREGEEGGREEQGGRGEMGERKSKQERDTGREMYRVSE